MSRWRSASVEVGLASTRIVAPNDADRTCSRSGMFRMEIPLLAPVLARAGAVCKVLRDGSEHLWSQCVRAPLGGLIDARGPRARQSRSSKTPACPSRPPLPPRLGGACSCAAPPIETQAKESANDPVSVEVLPRSRSLGAGDDCHGPLSPNSACELELRSWRKGRSRDQRRSAETRRARALPLAVGL